MTLNKLDRVLETCLTISTVGRQTGDYPWYVLTLDGIDRVQFIPPGGSNLYGSIAFNPTTGLGTRMYVSTAGAITYSTQTLVTKTGTGRETPPQVSSRLEYPVSRVSGSESLVLRGPFGSYAEFTTLPSMMLCDSTGKGWYYTVLAAGTGFAAGVAVTAAQMATNLGDNTWFRASGRTFLG